jgi:P4 family phage/plasmid primase-like protien
MPITPTIEPFITREDRFAVLADWGSPAPFISEDEPIDWADVLDAHRTGDDRIGMYTPDANGFSKWACIDIDGEGHAKPIEDPNAEQERVILELLAEGYQPFIERSASGTGWHVWVFFNEPVPARDIIEALKPIAQSNELFPKSAEGKETGNMVWLPWWGGSSHGQLIDPLAGSSTIRYSVPPPPATKRHAPTPGNSTPSGQAKEQDVLAALMYLDPDMHHDEWIKVLMAVKHGLGDARGKEVAAAWSSMGAKWDDQAFETKWESIRTTGGTSVGSLFWMAKEHGWEGPARKPAKIQTRTEAPGTQPREVLLPSDDSDITIAECVVANLGQAQGGDGKVYTYANGVWTALTTDALEREIHEYNLVVIGTKPLKLSDQKVKGIRKRVEAIVGVNEQWPGDDVGVTFLNGHLNGEGQLVDHNPGHFSRVFVDCNYTGAYSDWWPGQINRMAGPAHDFLQEFAGACLMGVAPHYKKLAMLYGPKDSGKSTFLWGMLSLFGEMSAVPISPQEITIEHQRARIAGARLAFMDDMSSQTFYNTGPFKSIVSGSPTDGRHKYGHPFRFTPRAGWLLATNNLPNTKDVSRGFFERFAIIECFNVLHPEEIIPNFHEVVANYRAEIAAWAVEGYHRLQANQRYSEVPGRAGRDWLALQDPFIAFIDEDIERKPGNDVQVKAAYGTYSRWASRNNIPKAMVLTMRAFEMRMIRENFVVKGNMISDIHLKNRNF